MHHYEYKSNGTWKTTQGFVCREVMLKHAAGTLHAGIAVRFKPKGE